MGDHWTDQEKDILISQYPFEDASVIGRELARTRRAVAVKASKMKIRKQGYCEWCEGLIPSESRKVKYCSKDHGRLAHNIKRQKLMRDCRLRKKINKYKLYLWLYSQGFFFYWSDRDKRFYEGQYKKNGKRITRIIGWNPKKKRFTRD